MTDISAQMGAFDPDTRQVLVKFTMDGVEHSRSVNAVLTEDGEFDREGTEERIAELSRGVAEKIRLGVIRNPEPEPEED